MTARVLYVANRYRTYDRLMFETLASSFELRVIWISPPPVNEPVPAAVSERVPSSTLSADPTILTPRDVRRNARLFKLVADRGHDCDLIITSTSDSWKARVVYAAARMVGVPIALRKEKWRDRRDQPQGLRGVYWRTQLRVTDYMERTAAAMLVGGSAQARYLRERGQAREVLPFRYLHPDLAALPVDHVEVERLRALKGRRVGFLYLGRIIPRKGLATLLRAFRQVRGDAMLFVVGAPIEIDDGRGRVSSDYFAECRQLAEQDSRIVMLPAVRPDRVHDVFAASDVFVHPHEAMVDGSDVHEGWGNVITEAASMAKPIITTDRVASAFDVVDDGRTGFRVPTDSLEAELVRAVQFFVDNPETVAPFGEAARRRFVEFVDPQCNVTSVRTILDAVARR